MAKLDHQLGHQLGHVLGASRGGTTNSRDLPPIAMGGSTFF